jgi:hypothetical protein
MSGAHGIEIVGRDFSAIAPTRQGLRRLAIAAFAGLLMVALGLSTLRNRIIDLRYQMAEVVREERGLLELKRALTIEMRRLRDPKRLAVEARQRGFRRPQRVVEISIATPTRGGDLR